MMAALSVRGVAVAYSAALPVFRDVSFRLTPGFHGLVGENGAGKTTLLRVLSGELAPSEGNVIVEPKEASIVTCEQTVHSLSDDVREFALEHDGRASSLRGRLELDPDDLERWETLSPGERKRWQVGAALVREPDVLLLDEPTNHLDAKARTLLVSALRRYRGIGVVVSHDRALLEELPQAILRVHGGRVVLYPGAYSQAFESWTGERAALEEEHAKAKRRVEVVASRLDSARRNQASAHRAKNAGTRLKDKNDHDAKSMGAKVVAGWAEARAGQQVRVLRNELARASADVPTLARDRTLGGKVFATFERAPMPVLFHVDHDRIERDGHTILRDVRVSIGREERVRVTGPNGAGKTTLLGALLASRGSSDARILHLPQELEPEAVARLARSVSELPQDVRGRVLSIFAALGSDPERIVSRRTEDASSLSPGEARKLALALGLGKHVWALVLDEPTNHLDLPSIERLEQALEAYPGAIVLVTHDDAFATACTTREVQVREGSVM